MFLVYALTGHLERVPAGGYGFTVLELNAALTTEPGFEAEATEVAQLAKEHCIVERALEVPVHLRLEVSAKALDPVPA